MTPWTIAGSVFAALSLAVSFASVLYQLGYYRGLQDRDQAYLHGRKDADNWWIGIEDEVGQEKRERARFP